ncbi:hypothetical protein GCM10023323_67210 [Streptomyces thinghirensis]|uniref:Uncharacterized protein n=1 Tax=Streptomyces thinghirensis TaxID=551547 RepID=A0ABP9TC96_9ACTN
MAPAVYRLTTQHHTLKATSQSTVFPAADQSDQKSQWWAPVIRSAYAASVYGLLPCQMLLSGQKAKCSAATRRASCSSAGGEDAAVQRGEADCYDTSTEPAPPISDNRGELRGVIVVVAGAGTARRRQRVGTGCRGDEPQARLGAVGKAHARTRRPVDVAPFL